LGGIQSGYGETGWADTRARPALTIRTLVPAPPHPARLRNSRRFTRWRRATGPSVGILALLLYLFVEGKDPCGYWPRVRRTCRVRTAKSSGISRQLSVDVSAEASAVGPSAEASS